VCRAEKVARRRDIRNRRRARDLAIAAFRVRISGFALIPNGKNERSVENGFVAIPRQVAAASAGYDELPHSGLYGMTNERMPFEYEYRVFDEPDGSDRTEWIRFQQEVGEALEILERLPRIDQPRQEIARGFVDFLP